jgi:Outer membrane protein beta-barrel domain
MIGCRVVCGLAAVVLAASPVAAQTWTERVHVSVNAGVLSGTQDFTDRFEFEENLETGSTSVDYRVQGGFTFEAGLGYRIWKGLGAGASVSFFSSDNAAATTSRVPHPFFFNQPREVVGDATDIGRSETGVHIQAMYLLNPAGPLRVVLSGGPSFFSITQDVVTSVNVVETFPYDTAEFGSADRQEESGSAVGFNVGADVFWMFNRQFGVGGLFRFSRASIDLDAPDGRQLPVDAGGVFAGGGIRLVF